MSNRLRFEFKPDPRHSDNPLPKRIYAGINAVAFMLNQIERRYQELERRILEYDAWKQAQPTRIGIGQAVVDIGYPTGNDLVAHAWDLVDWCERLRKVLGSAAGLKKNVDWYKDMVAILKTTEDVRHFLQHFDGEVQNFINGSYPLMGTVIACIPSGDGHYTYIIPSTPITSVYHSELNIEGLPTPDRVEPPADFITFSIATKWLNISRLARALQGARRELAAYLETTYAFPWPEAGPDGDKLSSESTQ